MTHLYYLVAHHNEYDELTTTLTLLTAPKKTLPRYDYCTRLKSKNVFFGTLLSKKLN
jgi:hypothetical protein